MKNVKLYPVVKHAKKQVFSMIRAVFSITYFRLTRYNFSGAQVAREIGGAKAAKELGVPEGTIHTWLKVARSGGMDIGEGSHTPESAMSLAEELAMLRKKVKDQDKEIRRLKEENDFLEEASAFFAASRRKSARSKE